MRHHDRPRQARQVACELLGDGVRQQNRVRVIAEAREPRDNDREPLPKIWHRHSAGRGRIADVSVGHIRCHHRQKPITATRNRLDATRARMRLVERAAQCGYLHSEIALLDGDAGPDRCHDLVPRHDLAATAHEQRQKIESTRADNDRHPGAGIVQTSAACAACIQPEQAEPICRCGGHVDLAPRNSLEPAAWK
ncbi:MAG TPA: hypothetical protein VGI78_16850 [Acetobacteraceae bacterium]